jgi:uncharacterized membrane protein
MDIKIKVTYLSLPLLAIISIYVKNYFNSNSMLYIFFIYYIIILFHSIVHNNIIKKYNIIIIILLSISIVILYPMRTEYIVGTDIVNEFYTYNEVLNSGVWKSITNTVLDSSLFISIFPTCLNLITSLESVVMYKYLYPILSTILPVIMYMFYRKILPNQHAFLSSVFYITQPAFITTTMRPRTTMGVIFIMLILYLVDIPYNNKNIYLTIIFIFSLIVAHYSNAYLLFLIFIISMLPPYWNKIKEFTYKIKITIIMFLFMYLWYFLTIVKVSYQIIDISKKMLFELLRPKIISDYGSTQYIIGSNIPNNIAFYLEFVVTWLIFGTIFIGFIVKLSSKKENNKYIFDSSIIILILIFISSVFSIYAIRLYLVLAIGLYYYFYYGSNYLQNLTVFHNIINKNHIQKLYFILLIIQLMSTSGLTYDIFGYDKSLIFSNDGDQYNMYKIYRQDSASSLWLSKNKYQETIFSDSHSERALISEGFVYYKDINVVGLYNNENKVKGIIYLRSYNIKTGLYHDGTYEYIVHVNDYIITKTYDNAQAQIWR